MRAENHERTINCTRPYLLCNKVSKIEKFEIVRESVSCINFVNASIFSEGLINDQLKNLKLISPENCQRSKNVTQKEPHVSLLRAPSHHSFIFNLGFFI